MPRSTDTKDVVALALARGMSRAKAGEAAGVNARTVRRWLGEPAFTGRIAELRREMLDETVGLLAGLTRAAAATLGQLLKSDNPHIQLRAALGIIEGAVRLREHGELEARLVELEALAKGRAQPIGNGFHRHPR